MLNASSVRKEKISIYLTIFKRHLFLYLNIKLHFILFYKVHIKLLCPNIIIIIFKRVKLKLLEKKKQVAGFKACSQKISSPNIIEIGLIIIIKATKVVSPDVADQ